ncbi:MAG: DUF3953 domain-containing protein [Ruminococcus sp.]|nr:DUF3953 domain-containing protein [Ruminococcus sp.]
MKQETKERIVQVWKEYPMYIKITLIIGMIAGTGIIVFAILGLTGIMEDTDNICMPLMGITMIAQGIREWKNSKVTSIFSFAVAVFIAVVACVKWF